MERPINLMSAWMHGVVVYSHGANVQSQRPSERATTAGHSRIRGSAEPPTGLARSPAAGIVAHFVVVRLVPSWLGGFGSRSGASNGSDEAARLARNGDDGRVSVGLLRFVATHLAHGF
jgi:hypothetical protein